MVIPKTRLGNAHQIDHATVRSLMSQSVYLITDSIKWPLYGSINSFIMVVYSRYACGSSEKIERDCGAGFLVLNAGSEYLPMDGADMIRNLLLGSFHTESEAIAYYKEYWLPVEREVSKVDTDWDMKLLIEAFLACKTYDKGPATLVGGQTYTYFQSWLFKDMADRTGASKDYIVQAKYVASELLSLVSDR